MMILFALFNTPLRAEEAIPQNEQTAETLADKPQQSEEKQEPIAPISGDFSTLRASASAVTVDRAIDPLRIRLTDGRIVQLTGLEIPDLDAYDPGPLAAAEQMMVNELLTGKDITLYQTRTPDKGQTNRMGYVLAQVEGKDDGNWIQGALIAQGLARAMPTSDNPDMADQMFALEAKARAEKKGLWADDQYAVLTPDNAIDGLNKYAIVEGTVRGTAVMGNKVFLNFGYNWRTDFTVSIEPDVRKKFARAGINVIDLGRKTVRVRGWVEQWNGAHIKLEMPERLEILDDTPVSETDVPPPSPSERSEDKKP